MVKKCIFGIMLVGLLIPGLGFAADIEWLSYQKGMVLAKKQDKKIFLHFRADWCGYCKKMEKTTFKKSAVVSYLNKNFVSIKVDGDREGKLVSYYKVKGYPDNWFINEEQKNLFNLPGYLSPKAFLIYLEYVHTDSYKTMTPMEYVKSR
ncbi:MAG: thioredoxin family protein [Desulfobacteraceae bacterium]|nr:thioredoxin family protein [Desulfobacteraceae bacterium]